LTFNALIIMALSIDESWGGEKVTFRQKVNKS